jgi:AcrR family transcriptional regulator
MRKTKTKTNPEFKIAEAALRLAARQGWDRLTLEAVAHAAKMSLTQMKKLFSDKNDLLPTIVRLIDRKMLAALGKPNSQATAHDRLFEALMARIDVLQTHRRAITGIMDASKRDPHIIWQLLSPQTSAMRGVLEYTGLKPETICEPFVIAGLLGVYGLTLCTWRQDTSPDMSKTMAALDRHLRRAAGVSEILFRQRANP